MCQEAAATLHVDAREGGVHDPYERAEQEREPCIMEFHGRNFLTSHRPAWKRAMPSVTPMATVRV